MRLDGRTAIITGAGSGVGRAMAGAFAREGATVVAVELRAERLDELTRDVPGVVAVQADITDQADIERIVDTAGPDLSIVCNNAGILDGMAPVDDATPELWDQVMAVNLTAPFLMCRRTIPVMIARGGGVIVNTASAGGLRGGRAGAAYTASKWGVVGLTQNIAVTHGPLGIRCNGVAPGAMHTNIGAGVTFFERGMHLITRDQGQPPPTSPERVAEVAVFLASDAAADVNGVILPVDKGLVAF